MQRKLIKNSLLQRLTNQLIENFDAPAFYEDIRQNLENILNARLRYIAVPLELKEITNSLVNYGISDFRHLNYGSESMQKKIVEEVKTVIESFEPRASNVNVSIDNQSDTRNRTLKLFIELEITSINKTALEKAAFEISVDLTKHSFEFI